MTCQKLNNTIDKEKLKRQQFLIKYRTTAKAQKPGDENLLKKTSLTNSTSTGSFNTMQSEYTNNLNQSDLSAAAARKQSEKEKICLLDKIDMLESEIDILKSANSKLSHQISEYRGQYDILNGQNSTNLSHIRELNRKIEGLNERLSRPSQDESESLALETASLEIAQLKDDNVNLKEEIDKLYDEIGSFEMETNKLKAENSSHLTEITTLKKEIEDLNNELDELLQFKANYDRLKKDYDKLSVSLKLHDQLLNEKLASPRFASGNQTSMNLMPSSSFNLKQKPDLSSADKVNRSPQLELDWIRGENEKLLLDLEKAQNKLNDKINQYTRLKGLLEEKDEEMKVFIEKYEKKQTSDNDVLSMQKKILELERQLTGEREERQKEVDQAEEKLRDVLKRNDTLYSQMSSLEQNYQDVVTVVQEQAKMSEQLEVKVSDCEEKIEQLESEKRHEVELKESLVEAKASLGAQLSESKLKLEELNAKWHRLNEDKLNENEASRAEVESLRQRMDELEGQARKSEAINQSIRLEVESLNKEKAFIISQNENSHNKVMQNFLGLQEKYTDVNFKLNKVDKENRELDAEMKESERRIHGLENERGQLIISLKQESLEKADALEKSKQADALLNKVFFFILNFLFLKTDIDISILKNFDKLNELSERYHKLEMQKSKLEVKAKDVSRKRK